ncbi:MAG: B12-binding domain-containing radical SAM protein [Chloroflexota bacterium]|nr:MAG: B12-binding domain-containing radical SAM protein [Chloroflexota bacterium]
MKITFVYPDFLSTHPGFRGAYYTGIGSLSACLKERGHATSLIHVTRSPLDSTSFLQTVQEHKPDLLAFSATTNTFPQVVRMATWLRSAGVRIPTICGGIHTTLCPDEAIVVDGLDFVCIGEGEKPLVDLCDRLEAGQDPYTVPGIWAKTSETIHRNPARTDYLDLDSLPFPDRDIFDYPNLWHERQGKAVVMASRGCPYRCTYCCNHALREAYGDGSRYVRFRSLDKVIAEIRSIVDRHPFIHKIHFDDDILFLNKRWAQEFARRYREEIGLPYCCNLRPDLASQEVVDLLASSGCEEVRIGLESGNDQIRNSLLDRKLDRDQIVSAIRRCRSLGIKVRTFNMVGLPTETASDVLDTVRMNASAGASHVQCTIFYPYEQTRLYDLCEKEGLLTGKSLSDYFSDTVLALDTMNRNQVIMFYELFPLLVWLYKGIYALPGPLARLGDRLVSKILSHPATPRLLGLPAAAVAKKLLGLRRRAIYFRSTGVQSPVTS